MDEKDVSGVVLESPQGNYSITVLPLAPQPIFSMPSGEYVGSQSVSLRVEEKAGVKNGTILVSFDGVTYFPYLSDIRLTQQRQVPSINYTLYSYSAVDSPDSLASNVTRAAFYILTKMLSPILLPGSQEPNFHEVTISARCPEPFSVLQAVWNQEADVELQKVSFSADSLMLKVALPGSEGREFSIDVSCTRDGFVSSDIVADVYQLVPFKIPVEPLLSPVAGRYEGIRTLSVNLQCLEAGCVSWYTLDGSNPQSNSSTRYQLGQPITLLPGTHRIRAVVSVVDGNYTGYSQETTGNCKLIHDENF